MTINNHPITPPPELVQKWALMFESFTDTEVFTEVVRWGADLQLVLCENYWMIHGISPEGVVAMRHVLRPKPPSLKEQALDELNFSFSRGYLKKEAVDAIRRALEQLND